MNSKDKDFYRNLKRCLKKRGKKQHRSFLKRNLDTNPEEAHLVNKFEYGEYSSKPYNGIDNDSTRFYNKDITVLLALDEERTF